MSKSSGLPLRLSGSDVARFRHFVVVTAACEVWMGAVGSDGYGRFSIHGQDGAARIVGPHLVAARLGFGPIPVGSTVLHDCDVRVCVSTRPGHIRVGTQAENMAQAVARGRARGPHPGAVDTRGKVGASRAVQAAIGAAVKAERSDPLDLAALLADVLAAGDPFRQLVPLFPTPGRVTVPGWDDFPADLFDPRAQTPIATGVESLPLF